MYKGKFDAKNRGSYPVKDNAPAAVAEPESNELPADTTGKAGKKTRKPGKGSLTVSVIFYTLYFLVIAAFCVGMYFASGLLEDWLVRYQAAQPTTKCQEVFDTYFQNPDWETLYDMAGIEDTTYEGKAAFVSYMTDKVGDTKLTYMETSAGLSGNKKYYVKLGDENIGYFLLEGEDNTDTGIPNWELGAIELFYERTESITVEKMAGHTAYVNGVALDDSNTIRSIYTVAEQYLPEDVIGLRMETQSLSGLLVEPVITVLDENGEAVEVTYNAETDTYSAILSIGSLSAISSEDETLVLKAGETYALYMIEKASKTELLKYFDKESNVYQAISRMDMWMQNCSGYEFANQSVSNYYRYSDTLFSANVRMDLNVTRTNGTVKTYEVDTTLFFELQGSSWKCIEMTNVDVLAQVSEVRITFMSEDTVLTSYFYDTEISSITTPLLTAPEGKVFAGWYQVTVEEDGSKTYTVIFTPDENGNVTIPGGYELEPMVLYPLFEDAGAEGEVAE